LTRPAAPKQDVLDIAARRKAERAAREQPDERPAGDLHRELAAQLDESVSFISRFIRTTPAQMDAMALLAASTHVASEFVTLPRAIWLPVPGGQQENIGKTEAMSVTMRLSANPVDMSGGTWPEVRSQIFEADTAGMPCPTLYRDEISDVFGLSGVNYQGHPVADIARRGYKRGATIGRSTVRTSDRASCFSVLLFTGRKVAIPRDIRTRCIVFHMAHSDDEVAYFDERDAGEEAIELAAALRAAVLSLNAEIGAFRVRRLRVAGLTGRRAEVWEPLFAVAAAAGQGWLNRARAAFVEMVSEADKPALSPNQRRMRDLAEAAEQLKGEGVLHQGREFLRGALLRDELAHLHPDDYSDVDAATLARQLSRALPFGVQQIRHATTTLKGWYADDLLAAWEEVRPPELDDVTEHEEDDPFADDLM
jgi:Protein of unknown function (DUF3631)